MRINFDQFNQKHDHPHLFYLNKSDLIGSDEMKEIKATAIAFFLLFSLGLVVKVFINKDSTYFQGGLQSGV